MHDKPSLGSRAALAQVIVGQNKKGPDLPDLSSTNEFLSRLGAQIALTRLDSREIFREAVLACTTPLLAARISSGWAAFSASAAAVLVAGADGFFDLAKETADTRAACLVDLGAAGDLAGRLFRRSCIGHECLSMCHNLFRPESASCEVCRFDMRNARKPRRARRLPFDGGPIAGSRGFRQREKPHFRVPATAFLPQRCLNCALRLSTKAAMPSFWSSVAKSE
jgi:hypothetical protein